MERVTGLFGKMWRKPCRAWLNLPPHRGVCWHWLLVVLRKSHCCLSCGWIQFLRFFYYWPLSNQFWIFVSVCTVIKMCKSEKRHLALLWIWWRKWDLVVFWAGSRMLQTGCCPQQPPLLWMGPRKPGNISAFYTSKFHCVWSPWRDKS